MVTAARDYAIRDPKSIAVQGVAPNRPGMAGRGVAVDDKGSIRYRLGHDFQFAVVALLGTIAVLGITPFTILRAINGQWLSFAIDLLIQVGVLSGVAYAWKTGDAQKTSLALGYFIGFMEVVVVHTLGLAGQFWFYVAIVANFFLIDRRHALLIVLAGLLALLLTDALSGSSTEMASFMVTVIVCALLGYVFAYRTATQRDQLETLAAKDPLTGIYNRRTLVDDLDRVYQIVQRNGQPYAMLVLDLDNFKNINDQYGHLAGDQVLMQFARLLDANIRKGDRLYRYGGEEFVIVVPGATPSTLVNMVEKLRQMTAETMTLPSGRAITTSIGGAILGEGETVNDWFARADSALYAAKNGGRDRFVIAPPVPVAPPGA